MQSFICVDLGASSTRYCSDDGEVKFQDNNVCIIGEDTETRLEAWSEGEEHKGSNIKQSLDVSIQKENDSESDYFPVRALVGDVARRFNKSSTRPGGLKNKHKQPVNYISAITVTAASILESGKTEGDISMYIALPPVEAKTAEAYVAKQLIGTFSVKFNMLDTTVKINVIEVKCLEEAYMAITSFFFTKDGALREENKNYGVGNLLSLDIGASTTDLATVQNRRFLEKTGKTYKIGGNVVRDTVSGYIQQELGYEADSVTSEHVVAEGRVQSGNTYKDFSKWVQLAKEEYATQIVNSMQTYFTAIGIPLQSYKAIVVSGGGSQPSQYIEDSVDASDLEPHVIKTSEAMSYFIEEKLKDICDTLDVIHIGDNPRLANVTGLYIRASFDKAKRLRG